MTCPFRGGSMTLWSYRNPKERPTSAELLKHAWLADLIPRSMATPLTNISVDGPTILRVHTSLEHALPKHAFGYLSMLPVPTAEGAGVCGHDAALCVDDA